MHQHLRCINVCGMSLLSYGCCLTLMQMFHWLILSSWGCNRLLFRKSSKEDVNDPVKLDATRLWTEGRFSFLTHYWLVICKINCERFTDEWFLCPVSQRVTAQRSIEDAEEIERERRRRAREALRKEHGFSGSVGSPQDSSGPAEECL